MSFIPRMPQWQPPPGSTPPFSPVDLRDKMINTGDPFQDAMNSGMLTPQGGGGHPMLGAGMMGAGVGGMLGGQKYAIPGMIGGAGLGLLMQHFLGGK